LQDKLKKETDSKKVKQYVNEVDELEKELEEKIEKSSKPNNKAVQDINRQNKKLVNKVEHEANKDKKDIEEYGGEMKHLENKMMKGSEGKQERQDERKFKRYNKRLSNDLEKTGQKDVNEIESEGKKLNNIGNEFSKTSEAKRQWKKDEKLVNDIENPNIHNENDLEK
jgi:hypothetical protein